MHLSRHIAKPFQTHVAGPCYKGFNRKDSVQAMACPDFPWNPQLQMHMLGPVGDALCCRQSRRRGRPRLCRFVKPPAGYKPPIRWQGWCVLAIQLYQSRPISTASSTEHHRHPAGARLRLGPVRVRRTGWHQTPAHWTCRYSSMCSMRSSGELQTLPDPDQRSGAQAVVLHHHSTVFSKGCWLTSSARDFVTVTHVA
jgi:hypothetical protein